MKEDADYSLHAVDPDTLVDWELIEQVVSRSFCPFDLIALGNTPDLSFQHCHILHNAVCVLFYFTACIQSFGAFLSNLSLSADSR